MTADAYVLFPPPELASCLALAIVRDTRAAGLGTKDRLNYFPASPLIALTVVLEGQLRMSEQICDLETLRGKEVLPQVSVTPPQTAPTQSWSDGPVHAVTIGIFTDAWTLLRGDISARAVPKHLEAAVPLLLRVEQIDQAWDQFCATLAPIWAKSRGAGQAPHWAGSHKVADWTRHLLTRAALSSAGQSARSFERRIKRLTGQSKRSLNAYAQLEDLLSLRVNDPGAGLAAIAADAQFSDQSHMGRAVKRATGFPPGQLNRLIETEEAFWCYRLLGERL